MGQVFGKCLFEDFAKSLGINPAEAYQGRTVRVKGRVHAWKMPEIVIRGPDAIEIVPEGSDRSAGLQ